MLRNQASRYEKLKKERRKEATDIPLNGGDPVLS